MTSKSQLSKIAKVLICVSEIVILNVLFGILFLHKLSPNIHSLREISIPYGWFSAMMIICYFVAIWFRPISFYVRSSRSGTIVRNVTITILYMACLYYILLVMSRSVMVLPPTLLISFFVLSWLVLLLWRLMERAAIRFVRLRGHNIHRVIFVGAQDTMTELSDEMNNPFYGYKILGYFNDIPSEALDSRIQYLGRLDDVIPFLEKNKVQQLYCSLPSAQASTIRPIIDFCERNFVRFFSVPNVRTYLKRKMKMEVVGNVPVMYIHEDPLASLENRFAKRSFDVIVSLLFMIPFWLLIYPIVAIITKVTQPGPVFFKQQRNGINGDVFYCYKFRSMKVNAQADSLQATENDPRKTKFGNFLRKSSIDELPQFINVLKGDMSIVGPRPHMLRHTEEYSALIDKYMIRHWVKPGITGWAQVNGARGETKELYQMEDRVRKDIWYIENWSFWLDLRIIFMTIANAVMGDKQAY